MFCKGRGILAQLGEHLPYKQRVIGSSPIGPIFRTIVYSMPGLSTERWGRGCAEHFVFAPPLNAAMSLRDALRASQYGEMAQLARASGSYPGGCEFKSRSRYLR